MAGSTPFLVTDEDDARLVIDNAARFVINRIAPQAAAFNGKPLPADDARRLLASLQPYGFLGALIPADDGGNGIDFLTTIRIYELLFRKFSGLGCLGFGTTVTAYNIWRDGTPAQREKYLDGLITGQLLSAQAATEPTGGSQPRGIRMTACADGGGYRLKGHKIWITNGCIADVIVAVAVTEEGATRRFIVDAPAKGLTATWIPMIGQETWGTSELIFNDVWVPADATLGEVGSGLDSLAIDFAVARCFAACAATALMAECLDHAVSYAREREQWGKKIGKHQLIQELISDSMVDLTVGRMLTERAARELATENRGGILPSMAKLVTSEAAQRVASNAIQIHGGLGLSREMPLEQLYRDARMFSIPDGTTQLQKLIIGRDVLGMSAFA